MSPMFEYRQIDERILSSSQFEEILQFVATLPKGGGTRTVRLGSYWNGELRWARNRASMGSDRRDIVVRIACVIDGVVGNAMTNQLDRSSLENAMRQAEWNTGREGHNRPLDMPISPPELPTVSQANTWSSSTADQTPEDNGELLETIVRKADEKRLLSSGFLQTQIGSGGSLHIDPYGRMNKSYGLQTTAQCSTTIRHPDGIGSGWAGVSGYDFASIDLNGLANNAFEKCTLSLNPVRIEPGRYTVILEPQAVCDLVDRLMHYMMISRPGAEFQRNIFATQGFDRGIERYRSKLGLKVMDERISIFHDPADPLLGIIPMPGLLPVEWIKNGILNALPSPRQYALNEKVVNVGDEWRASYRMSGGNYSLEEMIKTSERALLVTRFSTPRDLDPMTALSTGLTRDGLWLVESGKISNAVRNFRWTESPIFILNNLEQIGFPVPVFRPSHAGMIAYSPSDAVRTVVVPPLKARDFSFTATIDAL